MIGNKHSWEKSEEKSTDKTYREHSGVDKS
jgi:hypothetical protein